MANILNILTWLVGIFVSLAVGAGMINGTLFIGMDTPIIPLIVTQIAGWIVVAGAIINILMTIFNK